MKPLLIIGSMLFVFALLGGSYLILNTSSSTPVDTTATVSTENTTTKITLEVANTTEERRQGLMYRESLPANHGMLFVFDQEDPRAFWMKNTVIPLDIIFLHQNGQVMNIETAVPEPGVADENLTIYRSDTEAKYVLEMNAGFADRIGLEPGDKVAFDPSLSGE